MISHKKIGLIAFLLVVISIGLVIYMMAVSDGGSPGLGGIVTYGEKHSVNYTENDYFVPLPSDTTEIILSDETAASKDDTVKIENGVISIYSGGTYVIKGKLSDGRIIVDSEDANEVRLVLAGADITSSDGPAIYVKQAERVAVSLAENTQNTLTDGESYSAEFSGSNINAALYSKDDLVINGKGSLCVNGRYQDGIKANDSLKITQCRAEINAADEGINVNDYAAVCDTRVYITSVSDGIRCENESTDFGFVAADGSLIDIKSGGDGISASSALYMINTQTQIVSGGGSEITDDDLKNVNGEYRKTDYEENSSQSSSKALKGADNIVINGGNFALDSKEDGIHSDNKLTIDGGIFEIKSGDDAIHADTDAVIKPERIDILSCLEGIEAAFVTIDGGEINIVSSDDGINATGLSSNANMMMPMGRQKESLSDEDMYITINGGNIHIECNGDGIDSNGGAVINDGMLTVYGPEDGHNSSLDFEYGFVINGGTVVCAGSSGMAEAPHNTSAQNSIVCSFDKSYTDSVVRLCDKDGRELVSYSPTQKFEWICISTKDIRMNETYTIKLGEDEYSAEINQTVTSINSQGGMMNRWQRQ